MNTTGRRLAPRRRRRGAVAGVAAVLALAGCTASGPAGSTGSTDAASSALPAGVTVELRQLRSDVAARQAQVMITNGTEETLGIGPLEVDDPRFDGSAERLHDRESSIRPGSTVAIPVQLPAVACPGPDEGEGTVTLEWSSGEASGTATAPLTDPLSFVPPLHERECRAQALAEAADIRIASFTPSAPGEAADLTLTIVPTGRGAAAIGGIHSTNLLTWTDHPSVTHPLDIRVAEGDEGPIEVHLPMIPFRCDAHVVQEDKRGTVFNLDVEVEGEPGEIQLATTEEMRGRILTWVGEWCGFPS